LPLQVYNILFRDYFYNVEVYFLSDDAAKHTEAEMLERETSCGLGPWRPAWLQRLASKKIFVTVYGLIGMGEFALGSYFVGTISTMEKRFKIPSQTSGKRFLFGKTTH
jgi:hypothetical protein